MRYSGYVTQLIVSLACLAIVVSLAGSASAAVLGQRDFAAPAVATPASLLGTPGLPPRF